MTTQQTMTDVLEAMIDKEGLAEVLDVLGIICQAKSDHIVASYQETELAKLWRKNANKLYQAVPLANLLP
jgi:hypothetical protein